MNIRNVVGAVLLTMGVLGWAYSQNPIFIIQIIGGIWLASYRKPPPTPEYTMPEDIEYQPEYHPDEKSDVCAHGVPMNQYCPICDGAQDDASEEHEEEPKVLGHRTLEKLLHPPLEKAQGLAKHEMASLILLVMILAVPLLALTSNLVTPVPLALPLTQTVTSASSKTYPYYSVQVTGYSTTTFETPYTYLPIGYVYTTTTTQTVRLQTTVATVTFAVTLSGTQTYTTHGVKVLPLYAAPQGQLAILEVLALVLPIVAIVVFLVRKRR
jgi:hypothetical protein